jgi:hypothetical protein
VRAGASSRRMHSPAWRKTRPEPSPGEKGRTCSETAESEGKREKAVTWILQAKTMDLQLTWWTCLRDCKFAGVRACGEQES